MKATVRLVQLGKTKDISNGKIVIIGKKMFIVDDFFREHVTPNGKVYGLVLQLVPIDRDEDIEINISNWQDILDKNLIDKDVDYEVFVILNSKTDKVVKKIG